MTVICHVLWIVTQFCNIFLVLKCCRLLGFQRKTIHEYTRMQKCLDLSLLSFVLIDLCYSKRSWISNDFVSLVKNNSVVNSIWNAHNSPKWHRLFLLSDGYINGWACHTKWKAIMCWIVLKLCTCKTDEHSRKC